MKYKITLWNQIRVLDSFLIVTCFILLLSFLLKLNLMGIAYAFGVYSVFALPAFYIHVLYYFENRNQEIEINSQEVILRLNGQQTLRYSLGQLSKIILYKPATLDKKGFGFQVTPIESYNYARIVPVTGKEIVITCLMLTDVEEAIRPLVKDNVSYERRKGLFFTIER
mgnify:CR=1 FL=1